MSQVNPLTQFLDACRDASSHVNSAEAIDRLAGYVISTLVAKGLLTQEESGDAYFEECVARTANLRVPAWDCDFGLGDKHEGWLQWTEGEEPKRV